MNRETRDSKYERALEQAWFANDCFDNLTNAEQYYHTIHNLITKSQFDIIEGNRAFEEASQDLNSAETIFMIANNDVNNIISDEEAPFATKPQPHIRRGFLNKYLLNKT